MNARRPGRPLLESEVAEVLRRLKLHRENTPKKIAAAMGCHANTICSVATGKHYLVSRLRAREVSDV